MDPVEFVVYRVLGNTIEQTRVSEFCNKNCSGPERREQLQLTYIRQNQICRNDLRMYRFEGKTLAMESMNSEYFEVLLLGSVVSLSHYLPTDPIQDVDASDEPHFAVRSPPDSSDTPSGEGGLFPY
mgnify:FL=1